MKHPYHEFITTVEKPGRYLGGEYQTTVKDWDTTPIRVALTFPDLYEIGMSHMGMKILYSLLNQQPDILAERAYTPWLDMEKELRTRQLPIYSLENVRPLQDFDILGFSLQYEMTYTNVLTMLDLSGLPIRAAERGLDCPLVIAGGPCAMNPEPMSRFIDAFVIGDGEEIFPKLARAYVELRNAGRSKTEILIGLAQLGGIYCPALYSTAEEEITGFTIVTEPLYPEVPAIVQRNIVQDINAYPYPDDSPVPLTEAVFDRTTLEIARGCTEGCRFCQAGIIYRPVRERDPDTIINTVLSSIDKAGYDESSLTSLSTADFSCVSPLVRKLMEKLKQKRVSLSVSSLRAYGLSGDLLDEIADVRNTSLTFAPEAGTQRMRDVINKNITEDDIAQSAHNIFARGWRKMKLYFMIGLPTETDEDVRGIAETAARMLGIAKQYYKNWRMVNVTASVSSFVPKAHTPFQWCQVMDLPEIQRKQGLLMGLARQHQIGLKWHESLISHIEGVMSRGDRKVAEVIERAWRKGARLDGWGNQLRFQDWMDALDEAGLDKYTYMRTIPLDSKLPWGHIHVGVEPAFLVQEYRRAVKDRLSPPCGKPFRAKVHHTNLAEHEADQRKLICYNCGIACDMKLMRDERADYLNTLGALTPHQGLADPGQGQIRAPKLEKFEQADPIAYRARFTKLQRAQFVSHSDLIRSLPRVIRRAGLEAYYSQGYHPKPIMIFAPALSLGVPSFGELFDFQLVEDRPEAEVLARLNAVAPEGIRFLEVEKIKVGSKDLARQINGADYLVAIPRETVAGLMQIRDSQIESVLTQRIDLLLESESLPVQRTRKERSREVDIRPLLGSLTLQPASALPQWLPELDWDPDQVFLQMHLQIAGTDSLKPEEILKSLFGHADFYAETARLGLRPFEPAPSRTAVLV
jgi:radical SAM family uncharacterized protein/radical SAM-linked protein